MRQVSCARRHATLAPNTAFAVGDRVFCADGHGVSLPRIERAFVSAGSSGQRE